MNLKHKYNCIIIKKVRINSLLKYSLIYLNYFLHSKIFRIPKRFQIFHAYTKFNFYALFFRIYRILQ